MKEIHLAQAKLMLILKYGGLFNAYNHYVSNENHGLTELDRIIIYDYMCDRNNGRNNERNTPN